MATLPWIVKFSQNNKTKKKQKKKQKMKRMSHFQKSYAKKKRKEKKKPSFVVFCFHKQMQFRDKKRNKYKQEWHIKAVVVARKFSKAKPFFHKCQIPTC